MGSEFIGVYRLKQMHFSIPGLIESDFESPNETSLFKLSEQPMIVKRNKGKSALLFTIDFPLRKITGTI